VDQPSPPTGPDEPGSGADLDWFGLPSVATIRVVGGLLAAGGAAALGALILGEYQFTGWLPAVAGLLFGLIVAELAVEIGRRQSLAVGLVCGGLAAGGLVWAGWISAGEGLEPIAGGAWLAAAIGFATGVARAGGLARRAGRRSPDGSSAS
jgi:hypothetical protein